MIIKIHGNRENDLKQLNNISNHSKYNDNRSKLHNDTSLLSAYIKFGCISIREVYWKIYDLYGFDNVLISQLFWREFYTYIGYYNQQLLYGTYFQKKFQNINFDFNKELYDAWCNGKTGFPIVDAGMNELNKTGYMHNRTRLITINFLNRILNMDYKWSEIYFDTKLIDYDHI